MSVLRSNVGRVDRVLFPVQSLQGPPAPTPICSTASCLTHSSSSMTSPTLFTLPCHSFYGSRTIESVRGHRRSLGRSGAARLKIRCRNSTVSSSTGQPSADCSLAHCPLIQGRTLFSFLEGQLKLDSERLNKSQGQFEPPWEILPAERF